MRFSSFFLNDNRDNMDNELPQAKETPCRRFPVVSVVSVVVKDKRQRRQQGQRAAAAMSAFPCCQCCQCCRLKDIVCRSNGLSVGVGVKK